jgi:hypothetical protein
MLRAGPLVALAAAAAALAAAAASGPREPAQAPGAPAWAPPRGDPAWVDVRAFGAVGDGVADDTFAFRAAAATGKNLFVPRPPAFYRLTGYVALRGSIRGDGSLPTLRMSGADGDPDQGHARNLLVVDRYAGPGLTVSGLRLDGGWDGVGRNGEWSHCVRVTSSRNVTIEDNVLDRPYGDCVFIGHYAGADGADFPPSHVVVRNNVLSRPRRCAVAIVSGTDVVVQGNRIVKANDYVAAIGLEPDPLGYQYVDGVTITGNAFDVAPIAFGGGAVSLNDPAGNAAARRSGNVVITGNHGRWTPAAGYLRLAGSTGLVGVLPNLPWSNVRAAENQLQP